MAKLTKKEKEALDLFKTRLLREFPNQIEAFELFGSKARGDADRDSDLDVLVVLTRGSWQTKDAVIDLATRIFIEKAVYLAPVVLTKAEVELLRRRGNVFIQSVDQEALAV